MVEMTKTDLRNAHRSQYFKDKVDTSKARIEQSLRVRCIMHRASSNQYLCVNSPVHLFSKLIAHFRLSSWNPEAYGQYVKTHCKTIINVTFCPISNF